MIQSLCRNRSKTKKSNNPNTSVSQALNTTAGALSQKLNADFPNKWRGVSSYNSYLYDDEYYKNHSYVKRSGTITRLDPTTKWLMLGDEKIWYDDIVEIEDYVPKSRDTWI